MNFSQFVEGDAPRATHKSLQDPMDIFHIDIVLPYQSFQYEDVGGVQGFRQLLHCYFNVPVPLQFGQCVNLAFDPLEPDPLAAIHSVGGLVHQHTFLLVSSITK